MARAISHRTVVNRQALNAITEGLVAGMEALGRAVVGETRPPDDPKTRARIAVDYGVWANGRKVAGNGTKPRGVRVTKGITLVAGAGFPARFNEIGTSHQPARPFFTPHVLAELPGLPDYLKAAVESTIGGTRSQGPVK